VGERSAGSRSRQDSNGAIRVWSEVSVTLAVTDDPPQFVKVTIGRETMCADNPVAAKRAEQGLYEWVEERVATRSEQLVASVMEASTRD
jgi:hypothetical protein